MLEVRAVQQLWLSCVMRPEANRVAVSCWSAVVACGVPRSTPLRSLVFDIEPLQSLSFDGTAMYCATASATCWRVFLCWVILKLACTAAAGSHDVGKNLLDKWFLDKGTRS